MASAVGVGWCGSIATARATTTPITPLSSVSTGRAGVVPLFDMWAVMLFGCRRHRRVAVLISVHFEERDIRLARGKVDYHGRLSRDHLRGLARQCVTWRGKSEPTT